MTEVAMTRSRRQDDEGLPSPAGRLPGRPAETVKELVFKFEFAMQ